MSVTPHEIHACNAAAHKILKIHHDQVEEQIHPHHEIHGADPLHTDHKEHIVHKAGVHGHHDAKPAAGAAAAPADKK